MAQNKADLLALINGNLPDNTTGLITPQKHREVETQISDSALNTVETGAQTVAGPVNFTGGLQVGGQDVSASFREADLIRAHSTAASQVPAAIGTPLQVEFGPVQSNSHVSLSASGALTALVSGAYAVRVKLQLGRTGAIGTSIIMTRILVNGVQFGVSQVSKLSSSDVTNAFDSRVLVQLTAGDVFTVEIIQDSAGAASGGLCAQSSSHGWTIAPTALLVVSDIEPVATL
jgi:hypothetical protein